MGLAEHMSENVSNNGQQQPEGCWRQWEEPDREPPMDGKPDPVSCTSSDEPRRLPALDDLRPPPANPLAPLNHHNQVTRFMAKQALGYIPKLSVRSPERSTSPVYGGGVFSFESPRSGGGAGSPSFRLPSLSGTPPLSPQKWAGPSPFAQDDAADSSGRPSLPTFGQSAGNFIQRSGSFESCASPIPPLKRQHQETPAASTHHPMSIADLCQPFRYMRAASCPSDTNPAVGSAPSTPPGAAEHSWRPAIEPQSYVRTQSGCSDADTLRGSLPRSGPPSLDDDFRRGRLERSSSMDAQTLMRGLKRPAQMPVDLTQWLDRPGRSALSPLSSLADSADSMHLLEQAGRCMRISDSPSPHEAKREKKLCAFPQCTSNAVTRGLCISHGGGRRCQRKGCTRGAQSKGLCVAHGGGRICRAAGCSNIQRSMGLCIRHGGGRRCSVKGCQKGVVRQDLCTAHGGKRKCRVPDCTKHVKKKGLCRSHANSMYAIPTPGSS
ncbi:WRKY transcription factor 19 [Phytophthora cinnamomi]|uniref:WRKY transcription factor 19 n=1 Tax=Phytophthora cinnamomi TaxID=4785 RepID=UPI00355A1236|nr:WRKY transcription factor 19 [Phytophthora cinnamomi]